MISMRNVTALAACLGFAASASAATSGISEVVTSGLVPGTYGWALTADGQGVDWTGEVLLIELVQGSIHNAPAFDGAQQQQAFWGLVPELEFDSAMGIPGDGTGGIAGGAGDLGGPGGANQLGLLASDGVPQLVSVTSFNTNLTDTGPVQTGFITFSNDAAGTFSRITSFGDGTLIQMSGVIPIPEPGTLALFGLGATVLTRRWTP